MNPGTNFYGPHGPRGREPYKGDDRIRPMTEEEMKTWNDCSRMGLVKTGIPFAIAMHFLWSMKAKKANITYSLMKKAGLFVFHSTCGWLLYLPFCANQVMQEMLKNEEKLKSQQKELTESTESTTLSEIDFNSYRTNLDTNYDSASGGFSHLNLDYAQSMDNLPLPDVDEKKKEKLDVTYDELRRRNRDNFYREYFQNPHRSAHSGGGVPEPNKEPSKEIVPPKPKNKYGDDME